jgi:4-hydroxy-3-polyprenylbenzoate decarboxylase
VDVLLALGNDVHLTMSEAAGCVAQQELDLEVDLEDFDSNAWLSTLGSIRGPACQATARENPAAPASTQPEDATERGTVHYHHFRDLGASIASGSFRTDGMVVCPCSIGTLSAIVHATSANLIHRAADVHLKERRTLILVPRETPLSLIQLENMRRAAEAGAVVLPAMPGFYHGPQSIVDLVDFVVARICDQLRVPNTLMRRWGEEAKK